MRAVGCALLMTVSFGLTQLASIDFSYSRYEPPVWFLHRFPDKGRYWSIYRRVAPSFIIDFCDSRLQYLPRLGSCRFSRHPATLMIWDVAKLLVRH